jgi:hypothetical protein
MLDNILGHSQFTGSHPRVLHLKAMLVAHRMPNQLANNRSSLSQAASAAKRTSYYFAKNASK